MNDEQKKEHFSSFEEFYPYYLSQHEKRGTKALHFIGTLLALACVVFSIYLGSIGVFLLGAVLGYFFAWTGHAFVEKNAAATFKYPVFSFLGDMKLFLDLIFGRVHF